MVEILISLPKDWIDRLQAIAANLRAPESEVARVLFIKSILAFEKMTLAEYDRLTEELDSQSQRMNAISIPEMEVKDQ